MPFANSLNLRSTTNQIVVGAANNTFSSLTTANNSMLITSASGVPSLAQALPSGLAVAASNSGGTQTFGVTNNGSTNGSNARLIVTCANGASSTYAYYSVNTNVTGNQWAHGASAPTNIGYCLWQGASPATGTLLSSMAASGALTLPLQPAFSYSLLTTPANVTGNGTVYVFGTDPLTASFDQGSNMTTGGVFTAPVSGVYTFTVQAEMNSLVAQTSCQLQIAGSNGPLINPISSTIGGVLGLQYNLTMSITGGGTVTFAIVASGSTLTVGLNSAKITGYKIA